MKRIGLWTLMLVATTCSIGWSVHAEPSEPFVLYFHQEGCPDCAEIRSVLDELEADYPELMVGSYEITQPGNLDLLDEFASRFGVHTLSVPIVFVGQDTIVVGAELAQRLELRTAVEACLAQGCPSLLETPTTSGLVTDVWILAVLTALFALLYLLQGG